MIYPEGVSIKGELGKTVRIGFGSPSTLSVEAPVQLREGIYDVEKICAFTYLGGGRSCFRHIKSIGRFCLISKDINTGSAEHPLDVLSPHPMFAGKWEKDWPQLDAFYRRNSPMVRKVQQKMATEAESKLGKIVIGNDVWIGDGVFIRRGVTIGDGAVIAARSFVNKDVPPYTIVGGTPAKIIKERFAADQIERIMRLRWWEYGVSALHEVDFTDVGDALDRIENNIETGVAHLYQPNLIIIKEKM